MKSPIALNDLAIQINSEHTTALNHAHHAIDHAKRAGELLLKVKNSLPHGEFLLWIEHNLIVSRRQAQRYMRAALGKPITAKVIAEVKNDMMSYLPDWLPENGNIAIAEINDQEKLMVQEVSHAPGYFYVFHFDEEVSYAQWTKRGVRADFIEYSIASFLRKKALQDKNVSQFDWEVCEAEPEYLFNNFIKKLNKADTENRKGGMQ